MNAKKKTAKKTSAGTAPLKSAVSSPTPDSPAPVSPPAPKPKKAPLRLAIPPILLEGDPDPSTYKKAKPKTVTAPVPVDTAKPAAEMAKPAVPEPAAKPASPTSGESEPTRLGELRLLARDPYTLFAQWDFADSELNRVRSLAVDGMILLRVHRRSVEGPIIVEIPVLGGERYEFIPVPHAATAYACQLGYRSATARQWFSLAQSEAVVTAPDPQAYRAGSTPLKMGRWSVSEDDAFNAVEGRPTIAFQAASAVPPTRDFFVATKPPEAPLAPAWIAGSVPEPKPQIAPTHFQPPAPSLPSSADLIQLGSHSWSAGAIPSAPVPLMELVMAAPLEAPSSHLTVPPEAKRGFWFAVNAEVVVYGATEPNANVTLAGRKVTLRPDGSFSFRFSLPDGQFQLPITAASADGVEWRGAELHLSRATGLTGDVGVHPQDKSLRPPAA